MEFVFNVKRDKLRLIEKKDAVSGNVNSYICRFNFLEEYENLSVFAVFECGGEHFTVRVEESKCFVPQTVLEKENILRVGIFASDLSEGDFKRISTNFVAINVETGAYSVYSVPNTPDVWEECLKEVKNLKKIAESVKLCTNAIRKTVSGNFEVTADDVSPITHIAEVKAVQTAPIEMIKDTAELVNGSFTMLSNSNAESPSYGFTKKGSLDEPSTWSGMLALNAPKGSTVTFSCENLSSGNIVSTEGTLKLCAVFSGDGIKTVKSCTVNSPSVTFTAENDYTGVSFYVEFGGSAGDDIAPMALIRYYYCYVSEISVLVDGVDISKTEIKDGSGKVYTPDISGCFEAESVSPAMSFSGEGMLLELTYNQDTAAALLEKANEAIFSQREEIVNDVLAALPDGDEVSY